MLELNPIVATLLVLLGAFALGGLSTTVGASWAEEGNGPKMRVIAGGIAALFIAYGLIGSGELRSLTPGSTSSRASSQGGSTEGFLAGEEDANGAAGSGLGRRRSGSSASSGAAGGGRFGGSGDAPGVTSTSVKVGFTYETDSDAFAASAGGTLPETGDAGDQIETIVNYVNKTGGIAGRQLVPIIHTIQLTSTDPNQHQSICNQFTQEDKVFVVDHSATLECYARARTLAFQYESLGQGTDSEMLASLSPFAWRPASATLDQAGASLVEGLAGAGFFGLGSSVGLVAYDNAPGHRNYENVMAPRLAALGYPHQVRYVSGIRSFADIGNTVSQIQSSAVEMCLQGVNRVFFMVPGGLAPSIFAQQAASQNCHPRYGFTSYDQPGLQTELGNWSGIQDELVGSMGVGWSPVSDIASTHQDPWPFTPEEKKCHKVFSETGEAFNSRLNSIGQIGLCDYAFFLQASASGLNAAGSLTIQNWTTSVEGLGTSFQNGGTLPNGTRWVPGRRTGTSDFRILKYDEGCQCFFYTSANKPLPF